MNIPSRGSFSLTTPLLLGGLLLLGSCLVEEQPPQAISAAELSGADAEANDAKKAQAFLQKYGYLEEAATGVALKEALLLFQQIHGLPADGTLNEATRAKMDVPRCSVADNALLARHLRGGDASDRVDALQQVWANRNLTYRIVNYTTDISQLDTRTVLLDAFSKWNTAAPSLSFTEVSSGGDILLSFEPQFHLDNGTSADFGSSILGHAFYPGAGLGGDVHFNDSWTFSTKGIGGGEDLLWTSLHQIGHALGLSHNNFNTSVMYPYSNGVHAPFGADVLDIRAIYPNLPAPNPMQNYNGACFGENDVAWTPQNGATHYELYRSSSVTFSSRVLVYSGTDTSRSITVPPSGWYLRARSCDATACGPDSTQVFAQYVNNCM